MSENLANLLKMIVEIVQNHGVRIKSLEDGDCEEYSDDAELTEKVTAILAQLQTSESGFATDLIPSDQM